jgi:hypothetical protein
VHGRSTNEEKIPMMRQNKDDCGPTTKQSGSEKIESKRNIAKVKKYFLDFPDDVLLEQLTFNRGTYLAIPEVYDFAIELARERGLLPKIVEFENRILPQPGGFKFRGNQMFFLIYGVCWVAATIILFNVSDDGNKIGASFWGLIVAFVPASLITAILYFVFHRIYGPNEEWCPTCNRPRARILAGTANERTFVEMVSSLKTTRHYDAGGAYVGSSETEVKEPRERTERDYHYRCKFCNHKWTVHD